MIEAVPDAAGFPVVEPGERHPARAELESIAGEIREYPGAKIIVEGHTDSVGTPEKNQALSVNRAEAVKAFLGTAGLEGFPFEVRGCGESRPIAPNDTDEGRAKNRRVVILVIPR